MMQFTTDQLLYKLKCTKNLNQEHTILEPTSFYLLQVKNMSIPAKEHSITNGISRTPI